MRRVNAGSLRTVLGPALPFATLRDGTLARTRSGPTKRASATQATPTKAMPIDTHPVRAAPLNPPMRPALHNKPAVRYKLPRHKLAARKDAPATADSNTHKSRNNQTVHVARPASDGSQPGAHHCASATRVSAAGKVACKDK